LRKVFEESLTHVNVGLLDAETGQPKSAWPMKYVCILFSNSIDACTLIRIFISSALAVSTAHARNSMAAMFGSCVEQDATYG
jgi:hypothetical protein